MMGHNSNWNLDLHFKNGIGAGFIFCAYSFPLGYFEKTKVSGYSLERVMPLSLIDFQFYGKKKSSELSTGNFDSYDFHPANADRDDLTSVYLINCIEASINYQEAQGISRVIIPSPYEHFKLEELLGPIRTINTWLKKRRKEGVEYYMTIPITNHMVIDEVKMEALLHELTGMHICFDGFYVACETKPETRRKVSTEIKYLMNLSRFLKVLKMQDFKIIYAYANWDALLLFAQVDIDYITVATFENLRNFSIKRFITSAEGGGPSDGWYFSEKLLNVIKAQYVPLIRRQGALELIENEENIFSDVILQEDYAWSNMKAEVHKNYVVAVNSLFKSLASFPAGQERIDELSSKINQAQDLYDILARRGIRLIDESSNYHLDVWKIFLASL